ncbi:MAG: hypothetical protein KGL19_15575, partial [Bacteroidota bacterium]|nr:hypothetical protein [Bacteroidota bacterium]
MKKWILVFVTIIIICIISTFVFIPTSLKVSGYQTAPVPAGAISRIFERGGDFSKWWPGEKNNDSQSLGDYLPSIQTFPQIEQIIKSYREKSFLDLSIRKRFKNINQTLCQLILDAPTPAFLLSPVVDYIDRVNKEKLFNEPFNFA